MKKKINREKSFPKFHFVISRQIAAAIETRESMHLNQHVSADIIRYAAEAECDIGLHLDGYAEKPIHYSEEVNL